MIGGLGLCLLLGTAGCTTVEGGGGSGGQTTSAPAAASVPAGSRLARIETGMTDLQVRKILGEPDNQSNYMTGKAWIPFYFGGDTHRSEWIYNRVGRVVFTRNRWSGSLTVINRIHNPNEGV